MKRLFAVVLAIMLCAALMVPAFAAEPTGTITINNAEQGQTYHVVKVFDAHVKVIGDTSGTGSTTNVSYTIDKSQNENLYNLIKMDLPFTKTDGTSIINPFVLHTTDDPNVFAVTHKDAIDGKTEFGRGWLYGWFNATNGWNIADSAAKALGENDINTLSFNNLPYGYYMIYKTNTAGEKAAIASVVNLTSASAVISDKNPRSPGDPDKTIKVDGAQAHTAEVEVGDVVTYQASFMATNYRTYDNPISTKQITSYTIRDDAKGLKYKSLDSMVIYTTKDTEGNFSGEVKRWEWPDAEGNLPPYTTDATFGDYSMTIPWVDAETGKSLYPSPCYVVLTYQMYVTEKALNNTYNNTATNTFSPSFTIDNTTTPIDNPPSVKVYTSGLSLAKTDKSGHALDGAKFILAKVDDAGKETYYTLTDNTSTVTGETWQDVTWVADKKDALIKVASNNPDEQTFGGLKSGKYHLYEVDTPDGFNFPGFDYWEIEISYDEASTTPFSATIKASNAATAQVLPLASTTSGATRNYFLASIVNEGGSPLPQTGAAGTTVMLTIGGIIFFVTMLVLVTKKRLYNMG